MDEERLREARSLHRAGSVEQALALYAQLTDEAPERADPWYLRSLAELELGQAAPARASVDRAIALDPGQPYFLLQAGQVAEGEGEPARAIELYRQAIDARPGLTLGWSRLGAVLLALERRDEAQQAFEKVLAADPRSAPAHYGLAKIHDARGDADRALALAEAAARIDPRLDGAWVLAGDICRRRRDAVGALRCYRGAMAGAPGKPGPGIALAEMLRECGATDEAVSAYRDVARRHPGHFKAALGARLLLPAVYESTEHLDRCRQEYGRGLRELLDDSARFTGSRAAEALQGVSWTNFYLAYQGGDDRELQSLYGDLVRRVLEPVVPDLLARPPRKARSDRRLRVGFCSHFFFNCTAGRYFASWILALDAARFESFVYYTNPWVADDTRAIAAAAAHFRHAPGIGIEALARAILADELDILVYPELGMHPDIFALASLRLAPVQCAGWGHPTTTGLPSIDWFLSCETMEPEAARASYRERLALLPGLGTAYARPSTGHEESRADFSLPADRTLYLIPQSVYKIHPDNDALVAGVLARDPRGMAVFFAPNYPALLEAFAARLRPVFARHGLSLDRHAAFLPYMPHGAYLRVNQLCDVMLDTVHWSGGNTSLDAIASGLPLVTLPGNLMRGRQSRGMLHMLGIDELVATSPDRYIEIAARLGSDAAWRRELSERLRASGALFDQRAPIDAFEAFLERAAAHEPG